MGRNERETPVKEKNKREIGETEAKKERRQTARDFQTLEGSVGKVKKKIL